MDHQKIFLRSVMLRGSREILPEARYFVLVVQVRVIVLIVLLIPLLAFTEHLFQLIIKMRSDSQQMQEENIKSARHTFPFQMGKPKNLPLLAVTQQLTQLDLPLILSIQRWIAVLCALHILPQQSPVADSPGSLHPQCIYLGLGRPCIHKS